LVSFRFVYFFWALLDGALFAAFYWVHTLPVFIFWKLICHITPSVHVRSYTQCQSMHYYYMHINKKSKSPPPFPKSAHCHVPDIAKLPIWPLICWVELLPSSLTKQDQARRCHERAF
jgi:hypothetical protein